MATIGELEILDVRIKHEGKIYKIPITDDDAWADVDGGIGEGLMISLHWRELFFRMVSSNHVEDPNPPPEYENNDTEPSTS